MMMSLSLKELVQKNLKNHAEVFPLEYEGQKVWVKKARKTKSSLVQKFYYNILRFDVIIPVEEKTAEQTISYEVAKIKKLQSLEIATPKVLLKEKDYFVLQDVGIPIHFLIKEKGTPQEKIYYYLDLTVKLLAKIHRCGEYHGGAQTRNFTYLNGVVYAIDLEESFVEENIKNLQYRDLLLFLLSLTKIKSESILDYERVIQQYIALSGNEEFVKRLKKLANQMSFFVWLSDRQAIQKRIGSDVKDFFQLMKVLRNL